MKMEAYMEAKCSIMKTGGGQEEVVVLQVVPRIQEIIGEVAVTGVRLDSPLDSDDVQSASVSKA